MKFCGLCAPSYFDFYITSGPCTCRRKYRASNCTKKISFQYVEIQDVGLLQNVLKMFSFIKQFNKSFKTFSSSVLNLLRIVEFLRITQLP